MVAVLVLVSALPGAPGSAGILDDDAGSGSDAGDTPGEAHHLDEPRTFSGDLTPPDDADWYTLDTPHAESVCVAAVVEGTAHANVTISLTQGLVPAVTRPIEPMHRLEVGITSPSTTQAWFGLTPASLTDVGEPVSFGNYVVNLTLLDVSRVGPGDDGTGMDAGDTGDTALPVGAPCFGGHLSGPLDILDVYTFEGKAGELLALSLAQGANAPALLTLRAPSGAELLSVAAGEFDRTVLNETGVWQLRVGFADTNTDSLSATYLVGFSLNGPRPKPCTPSCAYTAQEV